MNDLRLVLRGDARRVDVHVVGDDTSAYWLLEGCATCDGWRITREVPADAPPPPLDYPRCVCAPATRSDHGPS